MLRVDDVVQVESTCGREVVPHVCVPRLDANVGERKTTQLSPKEGRSWGTNQYVGSAVPVSPNVYEPSIFR